MAKAKLKIVPADFKKLQVAAQFNNVTLKAEGTKKVGNTVFVEAVYRSPEQLFEMGRLIESVAGTELDETPETETKTKGKK